MCLVLASLAGLGAGCSSAGQNAVRADAARRFSCAETRITVDDLGPHTARASGCGQSLMYSCQQSEGSTQGFPQASPLTEGEAHNPAQNGAPCSWVPSQ
jgi:hypothetical protein